MKKVKITIFLFALLLCANFKAEAVNASSINTARIFGIDRYETSAKISKYKNTTSDTIVLVTGEDYPDSLCAAPLAAKFNAPILLTKANSLPSVVKDEINRNNPKKIFIIGGYGAVSKKVEDEVKQYSVQRIAGIDRYETSLKLAEFLGTSGEVFLTTGENYPDALSVASIAASKQAPILLTTKDTMPKGVANYLSSPNVIKKYVIGGTGVVSDSIKVKLVNAVRIGGIDRVETNAQAIAYFNNDIDYQNLFIASGNDFPDALSGAPLAAGLKSSIVIKEHQGDSKDLIGYHLAEIKNLIYLGGEKVVSAYNLAGFDFNNLSINPTKYLTISTYDNSNQACHPKVLYFSIPWNGWKYWMTYTPYPNGNDKYENPSIAVSNDGKNFTSPTGIINPLVVQPTSAYCHYSDPHLVFNENNNEIELWYRFTNSVKHIDEIYKKTTTNGIDWSAQKLCYTINKLALSPSIIIENGIYKMWYINGSYECIYMESKDSFNWDNEKKVNLNLENGLVPWHIDIEKTNLGYEMLISALKPNEMVLNNRVLVWALSSDELSFNKSKVILRPTSYKYAWDNKQIYRSTLIKVGDTYRIYYSAMDINTKWHIGLLEGSKIDDLINMQ